MSGNFLSKLIGWLITIAVIGGLIALLFPYINLFLIAAVLSIAYGNYYGYSEQFPDRGTYYHLTAQYLVDETEPLNFDLVAGCYSRDLKLPDGILPVYAKRTREDHVVMIAIPEFCGSREQANLDKHDGAFLPLAIWFESSDNLELGLGYSTIRAYDSPASRLTFLKASVRAATREEFEDWYNLRNENLITSEMAAKQYWTEDGWLRDTPDILPEACYSLALADIGPENRAVLAKYWPKDRPEYWGQTQIGQEIYSAIYRELDFTSSVGLLERLKLDKKRLRMNRSKFWHGNAAPETVKTYPAHYSDSVPALRAGEGNNAPNIRVDKRPELEGFSACYERYSFRRSDQTERTLGAYESYFGKSEELGRSQLEVNTSVKLEVSDPFEMRNTFFLQDKSIASVKEIYFISKY